VAAKAMRNLLTDHARAKKAERRGGEGVRVTLDGNDVARSSAVDLVELDETLTRLATLDDRLGRVFELRFLVGLSVERTADLLDVSARTVELDTQFIRAWLQKELAR
jgi:RNA polymerase sigma factor (TIGR02999 family)